MRYLIRIGSLKQKVEYLEKQLDVINNRIVDLGKVKDTIIWEGEAATTFKEMYDNYIGELKSIASKTLSYIKFLTAYYDKYGNEYSRLRKKYANLEVIPDGKN